MLFFKFSSPNFFIFCTNYNLKWTVSLVPSSTYSYWHLTTLCPETSLARLAILFGEILIVCVILGTVFQNISSTSYRCHSFSSFQWQFPPCLLISSNSHLESLPVFSLLKMFWDSDHFSVSKPRPHVLCIAESLPRNQFLIQVPVPA